MKDWKIGIELYEEYINNNRDILRFKISKGVHSISEKMQAHFNRYCSGIPAYEMLTIANGQAVDSDALLFDEFWLMNEEDVLEHHKTLSEFAGAEGLYSGDKNVKSLIWSYSWFPFAMNNVGEVLCIDCEPTKNGVLGQVIKVHDSEYRKQQATSLKTFIGRLLA